MDIQFLLYLQEFREKTGGAFDSFFQGVSDFVIGSWVFLLIALIYWCIDKKAGTMILMNVGVGNVVMQFFKNLFCVYRPWVRDSRIKPVGDSVLTATGYSFPSGHCQIATSEFGSFALWQKRRRWFVIVCIIAIAFVAFSRNYLGVHTPQDVIAGVGITAMVIFINQKILSWTENGKNRDIAVFITGMVLSALYIVFVTLKKYPVDYAPDGSLLADPVDMIAEGYAAASCIIGFLVGWITERRFIGFSPLEKWWQKIICFIIGGICLLLILNYVCEPLYEYLKATGTEGYYFGKLIYYVILFIFVMIIYPSVIKLTTTISKKARN